MKPNMNQAKIRRTPIHISTHAFERWVEYGGKPNRNKLKSLVRRNLAGQLKIGLPIDHTGAAHIPVGELFAAVVPGETGWIVVTFHKGEKVKEAGASEG